MAQASNLARNNPSQSFISCGLQHAEFIFSQMVFLDDPSLGEHIIPLFIAYLAFNKASMYQG